MNASETKVVRTGTVELKTGQPAKGWRGGPQKWEVKTFRVRLLEGEDRPEYYHRDFYEWYLVPDSQVSEIRWDGE